MSEASHSEVEEISPEEKKAQFYEKMKDEYLNHEYPYQLFRLLQSERRSENGNIPPSDEEIDSICRAWQLAPHHPSVLLSFCICLAETLRKYSPNDQNLKIIHYGTKKRFSGLQHAFHYLENEAQKILNLFPTSLELNLQIANIFSSTVPYWCRDYKFARLCLERALLFHSQSSKANVRMGMFALNVDKCVTAAQVCFEVAHHMDPDDFSAVVNLLFCSMNEYENKRQKVIADIFKKELNSKRPNEQKAALFFIRGLYGVIIGDWKSTATAWMAARDLDENQLICSFEKLNTLKKRYFWPSDLNQKFTYLSIANALKPLLEQIPPKLLPNLKAVRSIIKNVGRKELKSRKAAHTSNKNQSDRHHDYYFDSGECDDDTPQGHKRHEETRVPTKPLQAYMLLEIPEGSPPRIVKDAYARICLRCPPNVIDFAELSEDEIREHLKNMKNVNWAFSTLMRNN